MSDNREQNLKRRRVGKLSDSSAPDVVMHDIPIGPPTFDVNDNWSNFVDRLEQYFVANHVENDRKVSALITNVTSTVYKVLQELCHPDKPTVKSFEKLCELLAQRYAPETSVWRQRILFDQTTQDSAESVADWHVRVNKAAMHCQFGWQFKEQIRLKFVTGMKNGPVLDKLCLEKESTTLEDLLLVAVNAEAAVAKKSSTKDIHKLSEASTSKKTIIEDYQRSPVKPKAKDKCDEEYLPNKTCTLTPELAAVVGSHQMAPRAVVKKIWSIINEKNLCDPKNNQYAICNDDLMKVIGTKRFRKYGVMNYLKKHFVD